MSAPRPPAAGDPTGVYGPVRSLEERLTDLRHRIDDVRIREHLRRTEAALRRDAPQDLSTAQRERRETALDRLETYRDRGEFPRNRTGTERTPLFVGDDGTPCALAYLLLEDGREDLVADVMAEDPTVAIEDLPADHPVAEWIETNGLTQAEAARIQPAYGEGIQFVTTCGPVPCWLAGAAATVVGSAVFAGTEYVGYRVAADCFPENALKRRGLLGYLTVLNLFFAPLLALLLFSLLP